MRWSIMRPEGELDRRGILLAGLAAPFALKSSFEYQGKIDPEQGVTAPEDLMKEHGVLNRCLLIYEEGMRRIQSHQDIEPAIFEQTADLIRRFVEQYHEKNEETYIFPVFQKIGRASCRERV